MIHNGAAAIATAVSLAHHLITAKLNVAKAAIIYGNDDDFAIDPVLNGSQYVPVNADGKVLDIPGGLQLLASG